MSTVRPDTSRETATPLTDGCNNNRLVQLSSGLQYVIIASQVRVYGLNGLWKGDEHAAYAPSEYGPPLLYLLQY